MVYFQKNSLCLYLVVSAVLLWIPGSHSEPDSEMEVPLLQPEPLETSESPDAQTNDVQGLLSSLPEPYNTVTIKQAFDAQVGDECSEEAWRELTKPFWEQNFNKDLKASTQTYMKAHTGWLENPEFAGKSCFNNRHIRSEEEKIFPALALKCHLKKCVCYKDVLGTRKFKLRQIEIKFQAKGITPEEEVVDCVGDVGSNCNRALFPCDNKNTCQRQENGLYECVSKKSAPAANAKKQGKKMNPSVKKEIRNDKAAITAIKETIPGIVNGSGRPSIASRIAIFSLGLFASRFV